MNMYKLFIKCWMCRIKWDMFSLLEWVSAAVQEFSLPVENLWSNLAIHFL